MNRLMPGTVFENSSLEEIVLNAADALFDQAAQNWNHSFYWKSMNPKTESFPNSGMFNAAMLRAFGSLENFKAEFEKEGAKLFGSGWLWLAANKGGELNLLTTKNAANPLREDLVPIFNCDLWEHAYYIDYRNARSEYLLKYFSIIDWKFAEANYTGSLIKKPHSKKGESPSHLRN